MCIGITQLYQVQGYLCIAIHKVPSCTQGACTTRKMGVLRELFKYSHRDKILSNDLYGDFQEKFTRSTCGFSKILLKNCIKVITYNLISTRTILKSSLKTPLSLVVMEMLDLH